MISKTNFIYVILLVFFCIGCTKKDDDSPVIKKSWHSPANGYILKQDSDNFKLYGTSTYGCTLIDNDIESENYAGIEFNVLDDKLVASSELLTGLLIFDELTDDHALCDFDNLRSTQDPLTNFNYFWNVFNEYYAFFDERDVNWDDYLHLSSTVNENNLYSVLESMIAPLKDGHVSIFNETIDINSNRQNLLDIMNSNLSDEFTITSSDSLISLLNERISLINTNYLGETVNSHISGNMVWGLLSETVGYVNIISMEDYATNIDLELSTVYELINGIMTDVQENNIEKVIIDLRFNTGGYDGVALEIASRFVNDSTPVFTKKSRLGNSFTEEQVIVLEPKGNFQFNGEIVLLTSAITASAAEIFVMAIKDLPNVTLVGENTNGVFSDILTHRLPNGTYFGLSNQIYADMEGQIYEAIGIAPHIENEVSFFSTFDFNNDLDSGIERGLDILN